jgi:selenocysteine-specific elongation factor
VLRAVAAFHAERPMLAGISPAELATSAPPAVRVLVTRATTDLVAERKLVSDLSLVRLPTHRAGAADDVRARLLSHYEAAALAPPLDEQARTELALDARTFADAVAELKRRGDLVALGGMCFAKRALLDLKGRVAQYFAAHPTFVAHEFKTAFGLTRKHAIPLLEWLDSQGVTLRKGDARVAGPAARAT